VNIFGIGLPEMAVIMVLALLVFGPKKLPEIGRSVGKAIRGFQDASKEFEAEFKREAEQIEQAVKAPMEARLEEPSQPTLAPSSEAAVASESESDANDSVAADPIAAETKDVAMSSEASS
jgi:sec-independent protein translocase protein TatA